MNIFNFGHPAQHLAFWNTEQSKIDEMAAKYDALVGADPVKKRLLDDLLFWARAEAINDELYSD